MKKELSRLKKQLSLKIDECSARLIEISEFIHQNPEIGFKEYKSSQALIKELQSNDFIVEKIERTNIV